MNKQQPVDDVKRITRYKHFIYIVWALLFLVSLFWNVYTTVLNINEATENTANTCLEKDLEFREWALKTGNLYSHYTHQPKRYPNRKVKLSTGDTLSVINHVFMLKQFQQESLNSNKTVRKIISLKPLNSQNKPDNWEKNALLKIQNGITKIEGFSEIDGKTHYRIIQQIKIEKNCLKCHGKLGYKVGDVAGGISIAVPTQSFWSALAPNLDRIIAFHISIIIIGFIGISSIANRFSKKINENYQIKENLEEKDQRLKLALSATNAGVWDWNIQTQKAIFNKRWAEILGYTLTELEPIDIKTWNRLVHPDDIVELDQLLEKHYSNETNHFEYETRMKHKNGEWIWVQILGRVIERHNNKPIRMVGVIIDITERKCHEYKMLEINKKLEEENANKDKFFSIISHDLKAPFGALLGIAQLLDESYDELEEIERKEMIRISRNSATNIYELLDGLLEWSRAKSGRMSFTPTIVNINDINNHVMLVLIQNAKNKNITITNKINGNFTAFADEMMLRTILRNLISNAIKFTPKNGKIIVSAKTKENEVEISIKDNGIGISENDIKKLFRIDIHHTTIGTSNESGTGVGLILCKELVNKNGGKIWVESEFGKGSNFIFTLPLNG